MKEGIEKPKTGSEPEREEKIYEELLKKRGLERYRLPEKLKEELRPLIQKREELEKAILGEIIELKPKEKKLEAELEEEIRKTEQALTQRLRVKEEEIKSMQVESRKRLLDFSRKSWSIKKALEEAKNEKIKLMKKIGEKVSVWRERPEWGEEIVYLDQLIKRGENKIEKELPNQNPEAFLAHWLFKLREYKRQLPTGIVETSGIKKLKEEAVEKLIKSRLIALVGETGTGKTKLAEKIGEELTEGEEFVAGHGFMTKEELLYHLGISPQEAKAEEIPELIEEAQQRYLNLNPDLPKTKKEKAKEQIEEVVKGKAMAKALQTEVFFAPVIKAAEEGKICIIDEFNYIPPSLLAGLNRYIEAEPGKKFTVMGKEVKIKPGFGIVLTGNITRADFKRYQQRRDMDPAFINRINAGLIWYPAPPQVINKSLPESILERKDYEAGQEPGKRDLFLIGLTHLIDLKGNLRASPDILQKTWVLAREFSLLQKIFAGEKVEEMPSSIAGTRFCLETYHASMRSFGAILKQWKENNYRYPLEWYLYDNLIRPASIISPNEAAQIFYLLKEHGEFFKDKPWNKIEIDTTSWRIEGLEKIEELSKQDFEKKEIIYKFFLPKEITEAAAGVKMPGLQIETIKEERLAKENRERLRELEEMLKTTIMTEEIERATETYCKDEEELAKK